MCRHANEQVCESDMSLMVSFLKKSRNANGQLGELDRLMVSFCDDISERRWTPTRTEPVFDGFALCFEKTMNRNTNEQLCELDNCFSVSYC